MGGIFLALVTSAPCLWLFFTGASLAVILLASTSSGTGHPIDPFATYTRTLGDASDANFLPQGFTCEVEIVPTFARICALKPTVGTFSEVRVRITITQEPRYQMTFTLRQNTLDMGDLILLWGTPEIRGDARYTAFHWTRVQANAFVSQRGKRWSYFEPVTSVTVTF